jgi:uncharacterized membrane protein YedE/YeeE
MTRRPTDPDHLPLDDDGATPLRAPADGGVLAWGGYLAAGTALGVVFMQSEVLSWYRIQEMFRFQSIHMYGVIAVAVVVASLSQAVLRRTGARTLGGDVIDVPRKTWTRWGARYAFGGFVFGLGWALLGACPGPIFTLIGAGHSVYIVALVAALAGTWLYAAVRHRLPH